MARSFEQRTAPDTWRLVGCCRVNFLTPLGPSRSSRSELRSLGGDHFGRSVLCGAVDGVDELTIWGVHFRSSPVCCGVGTLAKDDRNRDPLAVERRAGRAVEPAVGRAVAAVGPATGSIPHRSAHRGFDNLPTYLRHPEVSG